MVSWLVGRWSVVGGRLVGSFKETLFNILSSNFAPTPNKPLRFTRFRRSYVNRTVVVLTNHCQSYPAFLLDVRFSKWLLSFFFFYSFLSPMILQLRSLFLLSTPAVWMSLTPRWVSRRKDMKLLSINIWKTTVGVKQQWSVQSAAEHRFLLMPI